MDCDSEEYQIREFVEKPFLKISLSQITQEAECDDLVTEENAEQSHIQVNLSSCRSEFHIRNSLNLSAKDGELRFSRFLKEKSIFNQRQSRLSAKECNPNPKRTLRISSLVLSKRSQSKQNTQNNINSRSNLSLFSKLSPKPPNQGQLIQSKSEQTQQKISESIVHQILTDDLQKQNSSIDITSIVSLMKKRSGCQQQKAKPQNIAQAISEKLRQKSNKSFLKLTFRR